MEFVAPPTGADVAAFLGRGTDTALVALASAHVPLVVSFIRAYTRGQGFDDGGDLSEDLYAVAVTACARLVVNPSQVEREQADSYAVAGSFAGFSLIEQTVLNGHRRRTA